MSFIKNLIKESENKPNKSKNDKEINDDDEKERKPRSLVQSATDLQRLRLEKLMKNPDKLVIIPEPRKEKDYMQTVPSFVRNVMGSSAGAGSGEFHVYRHLRRKEYARQKTIQLKGQREQLDEDYQNKLEANRRMAEEKTAKKRAKRMKKKQRAKRPRQQNAETCNEENNEESTDSSIEGVGRKDELDTYVNENNEPTVEHNDEAEETIVKAEINSQKVHKNQDIETADMENQQAVDQNSDNIEENSQKSTEMNNQVGCKESKDIAMERIVEYNDDKQEIKDAEAEENAKIQDQPKSKNCGHLKQHQKINDDDTEEIKKCHEKSVEV